jgi:hypothetical protein
MMISYTFVQYIQFKVKGSYKNSPLIKIVLVLFSQRQRGLTDLVQKCGPKGKYKQAYANTELICSITDFTTENPNYSILSAPCATWLHLDRFRTTKRIYRVIQKELHNFESVYKFISRAYTTFCTVIL